MRASGRSADSRDGSPLLYPVELRALVVCLAYPIGGSAEIAEPDAGLPPLRLAENFVESGTRNQATAFANVALAGEKIVGYGRTESTAGHSSCTDTNQMDSRSRENRYPSLDEFQGWYNLGYQRPDGIPVLHSKTRVPEFEHAEFFELYVAENSWFEKLVPASALKPFDPLLDPPMFVKSDADDRTLVVCPDFDYVTIPLLNKIQKEFLGRHPLWRVVLAAEDPSCCIMIYPEAIRFGNLPFGTDPEEALRHLATLAIAAREARLLPRRMQMAFLQQRLPDAVREIGDQPFFVAGVLDNNRGDFGRLTVLFLVRGVDDRVIRASLHTAIGDKGLWVGGDIAVNAHGSITSPKDNPEAVRFGVALCHPPADYRGPLTITDRETGKSFTYELKSENITRTVPVD